MTKLKTAKQVREGGKIYGQLPNRLTQGKVKTLLEVIELIAIFAVMVMILGSVFIGG